MNRLTRTALISALVLASPATFAGSSPQQVTFDVSITLENDCTIVFNDIDHGTVTSLAANNDAASAGNEIACTFSDAYSIALDDGTGGGSANPGPRTLDNGGATLNFNLYSDSAGGTVWGSGANDLDGTSTGSLTADPLTVYSRVFGGQTGPEGTYSSTITATATF